ncbi:cell division protein ZipA C-terminal FtsZ-binding domain-containing protein [Vreelandella sp. GE22]
MDTVSLPVGFALFSLLLGVVAIAIFAYWALTKKRRIKAPRVAPPTQPPRAQASQTAAPTAPTPAANRKKQHSLFVIFAQPDVTTDERLTEWLRGKNARFDPLKKVFLIDGQKRTNPIVVANAFPPGEMPDLLRGETDGTIRGVSLLVKPPIHRRRNQQMHVYVALAKEMNDTFKGDILDSEQNPVSEATYQQILGETQ